MPPLDQLINASGDKVLLEKCLLHKISHEKRQNLPLKKFTPIIEKIRMKSKQTRSTFAIDGSEASKALTTRRIFSFLDMTLNGLKPLIPSPVTNEKLSLQVSVSMAC